VPIKNIFLTVNSAKKDYANINHFSGRTVSNLGQIWVKMPPPQVTVGNPKLGLDLNSLIFQKMHISIFQHPISSSKLSVIATKIDKLFRPFEILL